MQEYPGAAQKDPTHWGLKEMADILQTMMLNNATFSAWIRIKCHWNGPRHSLTKQYGQYFVCELFKCIFCFVAKQLPEHK